AQTAANALHCWGNFQSGTYWSEPVALVAGPAFAQLTAGDTYTCGVTVAGAAHCFGSNRYGVLGDGTTTNRITPTAVGGGHVFNSVTAGVSHACGIATTGGVYCWGYNNWGELGDGTFVNR